MSGESHGGSPARRWEIAGASVGAALATVLLALALTTALPPSLANLSSDASDGVTPVEVAPEVDVVVPADWIIARDPADVLAVRTPDGALHATIEVVAEDAAAVVAETDGVEGETRTELLASGLQAVHADLADGGVVAVVTASDGASVRVLMQVRAADATDPAAYRPAMAALLEGIRA